MGSRRATPPFVHNGKFIPNRAAGTLLQLDPGDDAEEEAARLAAEQRAQAEIAAGLQRQLASVLGEIPVANGGEAGVALAEEVGHRLASQGGPVRVALERALVAGADLGVRLAVRQLEGVGVAFNWQMTHAQALQAARDYSYELVRNLDETSLAVVRGAVADWVESGEPLAALRVRLEPTFGEVRARLIASTETTRAYADGAHRAYVASGVVGEEEWLTAVDDRVCPICGPLEGQRRRLNGTFPGGLSAPPAHPGCRCRVAGVVEGD